MQRLPPAVCFNQKKPGKSPRILRSIFILLMVATTPLVVAAGRKAGGGTAGRASGGAGKAGGMHASGMRGNMGGLGKHSPGAGSQLRGMKGGNQVRGFSPRSTGGKMAFHGRAGTKVALHSHALGSSFKSQAFHVQKFSTVLHNYRPVYHERTWWATHYNRVVFIGGGWYYWDAGYWYPAWGYDSAAFYVYDGPIYSYDNLPPDEVIMNVQSELQFQGYYQGSIDGQLGPQTRAAIAEFQRDHELEVTSAVDEPTVNLLGLA
jgi:Putative peptidoglycan binding domain